MRIAVTGGLGAGKSTVCALLKERGATVVSADAIVHQLLENDSVIIQQVVDLLGKELFVGEKIDRQKVASRVFGHPELLRALEAILHPAVRQQIEQLAKESDSPFVAEIPLLFEGDSAKLYDITIAVIAPEELCRQRYEKSHPQRRDYQERIEQQLSQKEKAALADFLIVNDRSPDYLEKQVEDLWNILDKGKREPVE